MKQFFSVFLCIVFFIIMLCFPKETLSGATDGLLLWFQIVLPTLLPFFIMTNLLIQTNSMRFISRIFGPVLQKIFQVSPDGSFAVLTGFVCGYPIGAKVTADLVRSKKITESEGNYLLSFCNNTSPAFITSYIVLQNFQKEELLFQTLFILYLSPVLCSIIFRLFYKKRNQKNLIVHTNDRYCFTFEIMDNSIMNAFENITKVGGYIILFSIVFSLANSIHSTCLFSILEITNGIPLLLRTCNSLPVSYIAVLTLTSFGGICSLLQTKAMLAGTRLSITKYTIEKLITAMVTSLLTLLFLILQ